MQIGALWWNWCSLVQLGADWCALVQPAAVCSMLMDFGADWCFWVDLGVD